MRLTVSLLKHQISKPMRRAWEAKYPFRVKNLDVPKVMVDKGIEITDPFAKPPREKFVPAPGHPIYVVPDNQLPTYNAEEVWEFAGMCQFAEGIKQAQQLTKSVVYDGMPDGVAQLMNRVEHPDQDAFLKRIILQSQVWDPTQEKLPKRIDKSYVMWKFQREYGIPTKRRLNIFVTSLIRFANSLIQGHYPSALSDRRLLIKPSLDTHYMFNGQQVVMKDTPDYLVMTRKPPSPFAHQTTVDATTTESIPDLFPILPTIDFKSTNHYTLADNIGLKNPLATDYNHPHTFITSNCDFWRNDNRQARTMMFCMGYTIAQARLRFGKDVKTLPEPICVQSVSIGETDLNFVFFQLNTLDFTSDSGVKNIAWLDTGNSLYQKILSQPWKGEDFKKHQYTDFEGTAFKKLLAVLLYDVTS